MSSKIDCKMVVVVIPCSLTWRTLRPDCPGPGEPNLLKVTALWLDFGKFWGDIIQIFAFSAGFILCYSIICVLTGYATKEMEVESGTGRKKFSGDQNYNVYCLCSQAKK